MKKWSARRSMSHRKHRNIEEEFQAISPPGYSGIPSAQPIAVGVTGSGGADSSPSMSQASQEITQLEAQFKQQADLIQANTQALQNSTSSHAGQSVGGTIGSAATSILGGGLGLFSPIVSGIMSLFGLGSSNSAPAPLPFYTAPPRVQMSDTLRTATPSTASTGGAATGGSTPNSASAASASPQVTVNVSAMDSQSFMDRSSDIANAVREAMLNLHPINDVVANL
jgi:hypothetical protein